MPFEKISWTKTIILASFGAFMAVIIFVMIEVLWADLVKDFLQAQLEGGEDPILVAALTLELGQFVGIGISVLTSIIIASSMQGIKSKELIPPILLSLFINLVIWSVGPLVFVLYAEPQVFADSNFVEHLVGIPHAIAIFALYYLPSPIYLWIISQVTYMVLFALWTRYLVTQRKRRKL